MKESNIIQDSGNRLLAMLPHDERERLMTDMTAVTMSLLEKLYEVNKPIEHLYFPRSGVFSLITIMEDGTRTEVGTVGNEGMVGLPVFLGAKSIPGEAFCQVPGDAWRISVSAFQKGLRQGGRLEACLRRYTQALFNQLAQSVSCNRLHNIQQRCARWLLMTHDRVGSDEFPLTQDFLAQMLGVRRASVNQVARQFQQRGFISYQRGVMQIKNRGKLEQLGCECYGIVRAEFDRLLQ